jgi:hypothetical protein
MQRNPSRMPRDFLVKRGGGHWRGWRPSILSLNFHSALCIKVHGGAKFGGALPQEAARRQGPLTWWAGQIRGCASTGVFAGRWGPTQRLPIIASGH